MVEHFAGWDGKSPGKWDASQIKCSTSSQIRPRIRSVQLVRTDPKAERTSQNYAAFLKALETHVLTSSF